MYCSYYFIFCFVLLEQKGGDGATTDIYNVEAAEILANEAQVR